MAHLEAHLQRLLRFDRKPDALAVMGPRELRGATSRTLSIIPSAAFVE